MSPFTDPSANPSSEPTFAALLAAVAASATAAVVSVDPDGMICTWNAAATQLFGYPATEVLGQPFTMLLPAQLHQSLSLGSTGIPLAAPEPSIHLLGLHRDGARLPLTLTLTPWPTAAGHGTTALIHAADADPQTKQRAATEQQLRASEERFRQLTEHISEVFYIFDLQTQEVLYVSPSYEQIWQHSRESLYADAQSFVMPIHPDDQGVTREALERQTCGEMTEVVYRIIRPDQTMRWIRDRAFPVHDARGTPYRVVGLAEDITEQHTAEQLLQQTNEELERLLAFAINSRTAAEQARGETDAILNRLTEGFVALDANWRYLRVNPRAAQLLGCDAEMLIGTIIGNEPTARFGQLFNQACRQVLARQTTVTIEEHDHASNRWFERHIYPATNGVTVFFQEITERKQAEALLRQTNENLERRVAERTAALSEANSQLERAARLKDEFLANMSHELRTPLNAILTLSESTIEGVYGALNERQTQSLEMIAESGQHLLALINDILDLTKIEAGKVELAIEPLEVEEICAASLRMVRQIAQTKRLRIISTIDPLVEMVAADPRRLKQILVNLLSNAVKFTAQGGNVNLEVRGDPEAEVIHFTVADTGIGIATADIPRLFKPFVQLDSCLSRRHEGTGLGLALVSRLADLHGGAVKVTSTLGAGSSFTVSLPWQSQTPKPAPEPAPERQFYVRPDEQEHPVLLLAEDSEVVLRTTTQYLEAHGYRVLVARNGAEAVSMAEEWQPDLILMDIQMPVLDGLEATRRIRAKAGSTVIPVVALTALAMSGDRERCLAAGANDYLSKPVSLRKLVEQIEHWRRKAPTLPSVG